MRDLLSKVMTGSMVAGAALLVAACGGGEDAAVNNTAMNYTDDTLMNTGDVTGVDALNATTDSNALGTAADMNATTTTTNTTTTTTDTTTNTGAGTGNTTGM
ncbi:MAG TPA: hypothetical protein VFP12_14430 [Allosphingosinicella sp.]|nr:hypothetical protein [Allosphingosinicella sp.]